MKLLIFSFLCLLLVIFPKELPQQLYYHDEKIITLPFKQSSFDFTIELYESKKNKTKYFTPDMTANITYYNFLSENDPQTIKTGQMNHSNKLYNFSLQKENCLFTNTLRYSLMYYNTTPELHRSNILCFAPTAVERGFIFPLMLFDQDLIRYPTFMFHYLQEEDWNIYIGGTPQKIEGKYPYRQNCISRNNTWNCKLDSVILKGKEYINTRPIAFLSNTRGISAPNDFLSFAGELILQDYKKDWMCYYLDRTYSYMECQCEVLGTFPTFYFNFDGNVLEVQGRDLFRKSNSMCRVILYPNNYNRWEFDISIFKHHPVEFRYLDNSVSFYSDSPFPSKEDLLRNTFLIKIIMIVVSIFNCIMIFILLFINITIKKQ